jgi:hypothetical protein
MPRNEFFDLHPRQRRLLSRCFKEASTFYHERNKATIGAKLPSLYERSLSAFLQRRSTRDACAPRLDRVSFELLVASAASYRAEGTT